MPSRVRADFPTFAKLFRDCTFSTSLRRNQKSSGSPITETLGSGDAVFDRDRTKHVGFLSFLQDQERKSLVPVLFRETPR